MGRPKGSKSLQETKQSSQTEEEPESPHEIAKVLEKKKSKVLSPFDVLYRVQTEIHRRRAGLTRAEVQFDKSNEKETSL
jgi:hypothetical protein